MEGEIVWQVSTLDVLMALGMALVLGFAIGVAYWEWIRPERVVYDAGSSGDAFDISMSAGPGGLPSNVGLRAVGNSNPGASDENNLDHRGINRDPAAR
jgi:hypothetical protein